MEVHRPKQSIHGLRELLKEVGIIVLGVLIALSAEQAVAWLHERHDAAEARQNIRAELAANIANLRNRTAIEPCVQHRLDELAARIAASQSPGYAAPLWVGRPQFYQMVTARWDAAAGAGRGALLSDDDQAEFGEVYARLGALAGVEAREQQAWARLRMMERLDRVSPPLEAELRLALADARLADWQMHLQLIENEQLAARLKLARVRPSDIGSPSVCLPMTTPRAEAVKRLNAIFRDDLGEP